MHKKGKGKMKKKLMNALRKMPPILSVGIAILLRGIESAFSTENDLLIAKVSQRFDIDMLINIDDKAINIMFPMKVIYDTFDEHYLIIKDKAQEARLLVL